jgi:transposase
VLAEIGVDRSRFADARRLKAFAGSAPITHASGKKTVVLAPSRCAAHQIRQAAAR